MHDDHHRPRLREVLREIVEGRTVKRARHELIWESRDLSDEFVGVLREAGYLPALLRNIDVSPGQRVPAFFLDNGTAYFGWVFWEKFTRLRLRKLFGSVVRNDKGDWAIQISDRRNTIVYANTSLRSEMDIEHPSGF